MLDKITMVTFLIIYIIFLLITIFIYLVIRGADICKTDEERQIEDEEQMKIVSKVNRNGGKYSE